jgi:hypothetical protein
VNLFLISISVAMTLVAQTTEDDLKPFKAEDGKWEAKLPGTPKKTVNSTKTAVGPIDVNIFLVEVGNDAYGVIYSDVPNADKGDPKKILDGAQNGAINGVKGKLVTSKDIKLDGVPGRSFEYEVPTPNGGMMVGRQRLFLTDNKLYQVIVVAAPETARNELSTKVLDSFKLTSKKPASKPKMTMKKSQ